MEEKLNDIISMLYDVAEELTANDYYAESTDIRDCMENIREVRDTLFS